MMAGKKSELENGAYLGVHDGDYGMKEFMKSVESDSQNAGSAGAARGVDYLAKNVSRAMENEGAEWSCAPGYAKRFNDNTVNGGLGRSMRAQLKPGADNLLKRVEKVYKVNESVPSHNSGVWKDVASAVGATGETFVQFKVLKAMGWLLEQANEYDIAGAIRRSWEGRS